MCNKNKSSSGTDNENIKLKFYNTLHHSIYQWFLLVITTVILIIGLPWLIYLIGIKWNINPFPKEENIENFLCNFSAGMIGIIVGFIFDLIFIERLRRIKKFVGLRDCLIRELKEIGRKVEGTLLEYYSMIGKNKDGSSENKKYISLEIITYAFQDIITSAENEQVFYHLPRYWILNSRAKGVFAKKLHDINTYGNKIDESNIHVIEDLKADYKRRQGNLVLNLCKFIKPEYFERKRKYKASDLQLKRSLDMSRKKINRACRKFFKSFGQDSELLERDFTRRLQEIEEEIERERKKNQNSSDGGNGSGGETK